MGRGGSCSRRAVRRPGPDGRMCYIPGRLVTGARPACSPCSPSQSAKADSSGQCLSAAPLACALRRDRSSRVNSSQSTSPQVQQWACQNGRSGAVRQAPTEPWRGTPLRRPWTALGPRARAKCRLYLQGPLHVLTAAIDLNCLRREPHGVHEQRPRCARRSDHAHVVVHWPSSRRRRWADAITADR